MKKSDKLEDAHVWQLKYYIYILGKVGIDGVTGVLEYPKQRQKEEILLSERDVIEIEKMCEHIHQIIHAANCPDVINMLFCKRCAYYDFCYVKEEQS